jgi:hypothetical protein
MRYVHFHHDEDAAWYTSLWLILLVVLLVVGLVTWLLMARQDSLSNLQAANPQVTIQPQPQTQAPSTIIVPPSGSQGPAGPAGPAGSPGPAGAPGAPGAPAAAPSGNGNNSSNAPSNTNDPDSQSQ